MNNINDNYNSVSQKDVTIDYVVKKNDNGNNLVAALFYFIIFFITESHIFKNCLCFTECWPVIISCGSLDRMRRAKLDTRASKK